MPPRIQIIGVPIDLGTQRMGVDMGPNALRYAGLVNVLQQTGREVTDLGNLQVPTPESRAITQQNLKYVDDIVEVTERLATLTAQTVRTGALPLVLGGDHSLAIGSVAGYAAAASRPFGLLWIDAHPDCNTPETTPSGNVHGMALAALLGRGEPRLANCHQAGPKLPPESVVLIGIKDIDPPERELLHTLGVCAYSMDDVTEHGLAHIIEVVKQRLAGKDIYVSFDLDVVDSVFAPGVGIRSHGGMTYREVKYLCRALGRQFRIAGLELVELNPIFDKDNQTAELGIELIMALLGHEYGEYQRYLRQQGN